MNSTNNNSAKIEQREFTADDYEKYSNLGFGMRNKKYRENTVSFSEIVTSDEADFRLKLDNGEELFQYLKTLGE
jgi:hypothetical protein